MKRPSTESNAHCADRTEERNVGKSQRGGGGVDAEDIGIIFGVGGEHERNDLRLALESFREHGTDGAIDLAAGEHFALTHAAFALDEAAGDASAGVGVLAVVDGQREKVDAFAGLGIGDCGRQHNVFAHAHDGGSVGLFGQFSSFK